MRAFVLAVLAVAVTTEVIAQPVEHALPPRSRGSFRTVNMAVTRRQPSLITLGDGRVVVIGTGNASDASIEIFNPATETFAVQGSDAIARWMQAAVLLNSGLVLITGGIDLSTGNATGACHLYNPADGSVTATDSLDEAREGHTATLLTDGRVMVAGGRSAAGVFNTTEIYDPALGTWSAGPTLTYRRWRHGAVRMANGDVYFIGGELNNINDAGGIERYQQGVLSVFQQGRRPIAAAYMRTPNDRIVIVGGARINQFGGQEVHTELTVLDPVEPANGFVASLPFYQRWVATSVAMMGDWILVAGGSARYDVDNILGPSDRAFLVNSVTQQIMNTDVRVPRFLENSRSDVAAVSISGNRALVIGARQAAAGQVAEIYDPSMYGIARGDFDFNRRSDVFWVNTATNQQVVWTMNGLAADSFPLAVFDDPPTLVRDADGGGIPDFIRRSGPDTLVIPRGKVPAENGSGAHATLTSEWTLVTARDFNGDGTEDTYFRRSTTGENRVYLSRSGIYTEWNELPVVPLDWTLAAVDDFDGDGQADILWRHNVRGENFIWFEVSPTAIVLRAGHTTPVPDTSYYIAGTGDFNGDHRADLVWRNDTAGHTFIWLMDGVTANGAIIPDLPSNAWRLASIGDYNGDEKSDFFWRNIATGQTAVWLMDGFNVIGSSGLPTVADPNWVVRSP